MSVANRDGYRPGIQDAMGIAAIAVLIPFAVIVVIAYLFFGGC
jgi:hypothetical protein